MSLKSNYKLSNIIILFLILILFFLEAEALDFTTLSSDNSGYTIRWHLVFGEIVTLLNTSPQSSLFLLSPATVLLFLPLFRKRINIIYIFITLLGITLESIFFYSTNHLDGIVDISIGIIKSEYSYWNSLESKLEYRTFVSPFLLYITAPLILFKQSTSDKTSAGS